MTKQLEVGKTYTSVNGMKWLCIAVNDGVAHMPPAHSPHSTAHTWKLDGTSISLSDIADMADKYRIVFEPKKGKVVLYGYVGANFGRIKFPDDTHRLTIPTLDGEIPEGNVTIKVEKL